MTTARAHAEAWVQRVHPMVDASGAAQIDIDELLDPAPRMAVSEALECAEAMRVTVLESGLVADVVLVIPLAASVEFVREPPRLDILINTEWQYGPGVEVPGLYLLSPSLWRVYEPCEEYRRPVPTALIPSSFAAYYRTWRTIEDEVRGWEYARALYVRTVP